MGPPILKALIAFARESFFGKEDPLEVLNRNKTSSVMAMVIMLLSVVICALIYSYVKLYSQNTEFKKGIVKEVVNTPVASPTTLGDELILERLQDIELKLLELRKSCQLNTTPQANTTIQQCP